MPYKSKELQNAYQNGWIAGRKSFFLEGKKCKCGNVKVYLEKIDGISFLKLMTYVGQIGTFEIFIKCCGRLEGYNY